MAKGFLHGVDDLHAGKKRGNCWASAEFEEIDDEREFRTAGQDAIIVPPGSQDGLEEFVAKIRRPALVKRLHAFKDGPHQEAAQCGRWLVEGDAGITARRRKDLAGLGALGGDSREPYRIAMAHFERLMSQYPNSQDLREVSARLAEIRHDPKLARQLLAPPPAAAPIPVPAPASAPSLAPVVAQSR